MEARSMLRIYIILTFLILSGGISVGAQADEGVDDPDFDYLPPDDSSTFADIWESMIEAFTGPSHAGTYATAKKRLYARINDANTLYCGCQTNLSERTFSKTSCGYSPRNDNERAKRIEAEHILPAYWIANFRDGDSCWIAAEDCGSARKCCLLKDKAFRTAHNDLVNLFPAIGELNGDRSNLIHAIISDELRSYGNCDFEVDIESRTAEPKEDIRGDVARVYFYMRDTYHLVFPKILAETLNTWSQSDPVSVAEKMRNALIHETQGTSNPLVSTFE